MLPYDSVYSDITVFATTLYVLYYRTIGLKLLGLYLECCLSYRGRDV